MKVMVTGLNGFTGGYVKSELENRGHSVIGLSSDLTDRSSVLDEIQAASPQSVIHLAGISYVPDGESVDVYAVNTIGTQNLLDALLSLKAPLSKVVLASSSTVYGMRSGVLDESLCPSPMNHYGCSKLSMECMAKTYAERLPVITTRPFNYTGIGQPEKFLIPKIVSHFIQKKNEIELGNIDVERDFSDVRWVARAYAALLDDGVSGDCYNLCSGTAVSISGIIKMLEAITGHKIDIRINQKYVRKNDIRYQCGDATKISTIIGDDSHQPKIEETLSWMVGE